MEQLPSPGWADGNTSPTRKRGVGTIPRLRVGLVLKPLVQLLAAISSAQGAPLIYLLLTGLFDHFVLEKRLKKSLKLSAKNNMKIADLKSSA